MKGLVKTHSQVTLWLPDLPSGVVYFRNHSGSHCRRTTMSPQQYINTAAHSCSRIKGATYRLTHDISIFFLEEIISLDKEQVWKRSSGRSSERSLERSPRYPSSVSPNCPSTSPSCSHKQLPHEHNSIDKVQKQRLLDVTHMTARTYWMAWHCMQVAIHIPERPSDPK